MGRWLWAVPKLAKIKISLLATLSTATGYILGAERTSFALLWSTLGIFLLACGASALNQYQERETDARMPRTQKRPLPSGEVPPPLALGLAFVLLSAGFLILFLGTPPAARLLGLLAVFWYNAVYLVLKRRTAFAAVPGALIGAIPPAVGWASGGGSLKEPQLLMLSGFFFLWQVPHFWLLLLAYGKEYEGAGLPALPEKLEAEQVKRLILVWLTATAAACLLIPILGRRPPRVILILLFLANLRLVWNAFSWLKNFQFPLDSAFREINLYALAVMALLSTGRLFT